MALILATNVDTYPARAWVLMRWLFGLLWFLPIPYVVFYLSGQPVPTGLAQVVDLTILTQPLVATAITMVSLVALWYYIRGRAMVWATLAMFVIGVLTQTLLDSQGAFYRNEVTSLIPLGQFIAFAFGGWLMGNKQPGLDSQSAPAIHLAITLSRQMVVATYFLAGITKLQESGIYWVIDSPNAVLQFTKSFYEIYFSIDAPWALTLIETVGAFWPAWPNLLRLLMLGGLLLEVGSPLAMYSNRASKWFGWLMMAFHLGICFIMGVLFIHFILILVVFFIIPGHAKWQGSGKDG